MFRSSWEPARRPNFSFSIIRKRFITKLTSYPTFYHFFNLLSPLHNDSSWIHLKIAFSKISLFMKNLFLNRNVLKNVLIFNIFSYYFPVIYGINRKRSLGNRTTSLIFLTPVNIITSRSSPIAHPA